MKSGCEKVDSFTLEMSKNNVIRSFVRNGRVRVNNFLLRKMLIFLIILW